MRPARGAGTGAGLLVSHQADRKDQSNGEFHDILQVTASALLYTGTVGHTVPV